MPTQVKFLLGALIAATGLIVASFFINVRNITGLGANILETINYEKTNPNNKTPEKTDTFSSQSQSDIDKDGLLDYEEVIYGTDPLNPDTDGDGFLDGEEIASKRNPLIPGPNDELIKNLTQRVSELTLSGLAEGSLKPGNPNYVKSLNLVVDEILYQSQVNLSPTQTSINIVPDSYEAIKNYESKVVPLIISMVEEEGKSILNLVDLVDDTGFFNESKLNPNDKSFQNLRNFSSNRSRDLNQDILTLETNPVPKILSKQHRFIIGAFESISLSYSYLAEADSDPIQAMMAFRNIINTFTDEIPNKLKTYK